MFRLRASRRPRPADHYEMADARSQSVRVTQCRPLHRPREMSTFQCCPLKRSCSAHPLTVPVIPRAFRAWRGSRATPICRHAAEGADIRRLRTAHAPITNRDRVKAEFHDHTGERQRPIPVQRAALGNQRNRSTRRRAGEGACTGPAGVADALASPLMRHHDVASSFLPPPFARRHQRLCAAGLLTTSVREWRLASVPQLMGRLVTRRTPRRCCGRCRSNPVPSGLSGSVSWVPRAGLEPAQPEGH